MRNGLPGLPPGGLAGHEHALTVLDQHQLPRQKVDELVLALVPMRCEDRDPGGRRSR